MNKEAQIIKFLSCAISYFDIQPNKDYSPEQNNELRQTIPGIIAMVRRDRKINKKVWRRLLGKKKEDCHTYATNVFASIEMFHLMRFLVPEILRVIIATFKGQFDNDGAVDVLSKRRIFDSVLLENRNLIYKWKVNLVALLLLCGNGQRNYVYNYFKWPTAAEMLLFQSEFGRFKSTSPLKFMIHED